MTKWSVMDDENNVLGTVEAANKYDAQDMAQLGWGEVIGLWIKEIVV